MFYNFFLEFTFFKTLHKLQGYTFTVLVNVYDIISMVCDKVCSHVICAMIQFMYNAKL